MSSTNTRLASSFKKLAAGLQVSQGDEEVAGAIALLQKHIKNVEYDAEDDPQVDIAVHALQTRAASSMEFLTKYEKIADKLKKQNAKTNDSCTRLERSTRDGKGRK